METIDTTIAPQQAAAITLQPDASGIYHPLTEADLGSLVALVRSKKLNLRVVGAAQSFPGAIYTNNYGQTENANINIMMDGFRTLTYNEALMQVTVGAGLNIGYNPFDTTNSSTEFNGLYYQLQQKGWAIPNVTDVIQQTVGGFISTGSSGASALHSFDEYIVSFRIMDGTGKIMEVHRSEDLSDTFYALWASMGLLGIILSVTLQCVPTFNIIGTETVTPIAETEMDFFGPGSDEKPSLQTYLSTTEYARMLWWPLKTLQRVISWKARAMQVSDYNPQTGTPENFHPKPYVPVFPKVFGSTLPSQEFASIGFKLIASWPKWLYKLMGDGEGSKILVDFVDMVEPHLYPLLIDMYFPCNSEKHPPQQFWDTWLGSLPMDTIEFSNKLFDLVYAEIWVPLEKAQETVNVFQQHYTEGGYSATGYYTVEVMAAKESPFWLSPSYGGAALRLNIMRFDEGDAANTAYFQQFWDLLAKKGIDFRYHWAKYLPPPQSSTGAAYIQKQYPMWQQFMALRKTMDPDNIFVNDYWKAQLGIIENNT